MFPPLYLDTARLGRMTLSACCASNDFTKFALDHGCSAHLSTIIFDGYSAWPNSLQEQYQGLRYWEGIGDLKRELVVLADADPECELIMAARSAELMKFSAKLFASRCNNVLITDLTWPAYQQILERERKDASFLTTVLPLRHAVLRDRISVPDVIDRIANEYVQCRCDGLFLPLVDNLGVHLPIQEIIQRIRSLAPIEFVVVDGAQSFGHVPLSLRDGYCDLFLAGCHKWLRAFYPLGLAFFGREESRGFISDSYRTWLDNGELSDPLLGFCEELQSRKARAYGETVLLAPLLTASAAAADVSWRKFPKVDAKARAGVTEAAIKNGWKPVAPVPEMESQILLFESRLNRFSEYRPASADKIKERFLEHRIALSAYDSGLVRIAFEDSSFSSDYFDWLAGAFADCLQMELEAAEVSPVS